MKDIFFERRGISYQCNDFDHARPTLVFIHGLSGSSSAWFLFEHRFTRRYNLLMIDLRGHGRSAKPKRYRDYNFSELVHDIDALIEHLGIKNFSLISHSFGTLIALDYLLEHQHKTSSAIFLSPNYSVHKTLRARLSWPLLAVGVRLIDLLPAHTAAGSRLEYEKYVGTGDWNVRRMWADILATTLRVYLYCLEHTYKFNRDSWWTRINIPTLIVHGRNDTVIPERNAMILANDIKSDLVLLDDANHMLVLNDVDRVAPHIERFVTTL